MLSKSAQYSDFFLQNVVHFCRRARLCMVLLTLDRGLLRMLLRYDCPPPVRIVGAECLLFG